MTNTLKRDGVRYAINVWPINPAVQIRFRTPLMARARTTWADALRAMREQGYEPSTSKRYRVTFVNHLADVRVAQMPSCMNDAVDGIANALGVNRLALLIGYQQGAPDLHGVEVVIEEVQP